MKPGLGSLPPGTPTINPLPSGAHNNGQPCVCARSSAVGLPPFSIKKQAVSCGELGVRRGDGVPANAVAGGADAVRDGGGGVPAPPAGVAELVDGLPHAA